MENIVDIKNTILESVNDGTETIKLQRTGGKPSSF